MLTVAQKKDNQEFLLEARTMVARVLLQHPDGLGIDDLRQICESESIVPSHPTLWGPVMKHRMFTRNGDRRSKSKTCHGRWINIWKLRS